MNVKSRLSSRVLDAQMLNKVEEGYLAKRMKIYEKEKRFIDNIFMKQRNIVMEDEKRLKVTSGISDKGVKPSCHETASTLLSEYANSNVGLFSEKRLKRWRHTRMILDDSSTMKSTQREQRKVLIQVLDPNQQLEVDSLSDVCSSKTGKVQRVESDRSRDPTAKFADVDPTKRKVSAKWTREALEQFNNETILKRECWNFNLQNFEYSNSLHHNENRCMAESDNLQITQLPKNVHKKTKKKKKIINKTQKFQKNRIRPQTAFQKISEPPTNKVPRPHTSCSKVQEPMKDLIVIPSFSNYDLQNISDDQQSLTSDYAIEQQQQQHPVAAKERNREEDHWRRDLMREAPPGLVSNASSYQIRSCQSTEQRQRHLAELVDQEKPRIEAKRRAEARRRARRRLTIALASMDLNHT